MITPMRDVENKVAFVTGGASGIGLGIVRTFLDAGMRVAYGDNNPDHLTQASAYFRETQERAQPVLVDITDRQALERAARQVEGVFGKIHVLVNNAGVQNPSTLSATRYEEWDRLIAVNLSGVFNGIRCFLPRIRRHGEGGQIVATSSVLGLFTAGGGYAAYCASKFAVVAMMEALRSELCASNIGVSILCPGAVRSNLEDSLRNSEGASDPLEIGRLTLRGMQSNDLYILTHPEFSAIIQRRTDAIIGSAPRDVHPSDERNAAARSLLESSIYITNAPRA